MSFDTEKVRLGREPFTAIGLVMDYCSLSYADGTCAAGSVRDNTAQTGTSTTITLDASASAVDEAYTGMNVLLTGGTGSGQVRAISGYVGATKVATVSTSWTTTPDATSTFSILNPSASDACYNTRATCQDTANYSKTTKEYKFCQPRSSLPAGEAMFPVIEGGIRKSPTSTTGGAGLGKRAVVQIKLKDFPHHDRGVDPYVSNRTYTPYEQGTFWGKFIKRNPYYEGRTVKIYYGYIGDTFSWSDFEIQEYDIIDIAGPDNGTINITAKDVLVRTYERKSQYPAVSEGVLLSNITSGATSATLSPTGIGATDYPASGTLSIGKEAMTFTRSGDVLTLTRAQWGTTAAAHTAGDTVQICATWDGTTNIIDVLDELLVTGAGLPSGYIPTTDWEAERDLWMISANVKGILMKPESIEKVIGELSQVFMFDIWWDATAQEVKIKALSPEPSGATVNTLTEGINIKQGSLRIDRKSADRYTEIRVYYGKLDYSEPDEPENFATGYISSDASRAGSDRYNSNSIKTIYSRWFDASANAAQLSGRLLARFADTPEIITFVLDQKDHGKLDMAGRVELDSWQFQDAAGANEARRFQVIEIDEGDQPGHDFRVKALTSSFVGRYFFIAPDATPDYSSASETEKDSYGFISLSTGLFSDGTTGHKII